MDYSIMYSSNRGSCSACIGAGVTNCLSRPNHPPEVPVLGLGNLRRVFQFAWMKRLFGRAKRQSSNSNITSTIPVELLQVIFVFAVLGDAPYTMHIITQVCKRWRDIALHFPALWCYLNNSMSDALAASTIHQSHGVPLHVVLTTSFVGLLQSNLHRVQTLHLSGHLIDPQVACLTGPKNLRSLVFQIDHSGPHHAGHLHIPHDFMGGELPSLRHVRFSDVGIIDGIPPPTFANLTHFEIRQQRFTPPAALLHYVSYMPLLECLSLAILSPAVEIYFLHIEYFVQNRTPVVLDKLTELYLMGPIAACNYWLTLLHTPARTRLSVSGNIPPARQELEDPWVAVREMVDILAAYSPAPLRSLHVDEMEVDVYKMHGWSEEGRGTTFGTCLYDRADERPNIALLLQSDADDAHPPVDCRATARKLCGEVCDFTGVQTLTLNPGNDSMPTWQDEFGGMKEVKRLKGRRVSFLRFGDSSAAEGKASPFPALERIEIVMGEERETRPTLGNFLSDRKRQSSLKEPAVERNTFQDTTWTVFKKNVEVVYS